MQLNVNDNKCDDKGVTMPEHSAGILMYRFHGELIEVLLVHPGGPFWKNKDSGAWSIPKGEYDKEKEDALEAAKREFSEETGCQAEGQFIPLSTIKQSGGKIVTVWAVEGNCDAGSIRSNTFSMEWPPKSGKQQQFPEVDRAGWFSIEQAREKILKSQAGLIDQLITLLTSEE